MADKELRIAIYETYKEVVEDNYGDFYNTKSKKDVYSNLERILYVHGVPAIDKRYTAELILQYLLSAGM